MTLESFFTWCQRCYPWKMSSSEWEELEKYVCQHSMKFSPQLTSVTVLPLSSKSTQCSFSPQDFWCYSLCDAKGGQKQARAKSNVETKESPIFYPYFMPEWLVSTDFQLMLGLCQLENTPKYLCKCILKLVKRNVATFTWLMGFSWNFWN